MIRWAHKQAIRKRLLIGGGIVIAILLWVVLVVRPDSDRVQFGSRKLRVERVSTPEARERGLSGRDSLPQGRGMLFVFGVPSQYCIWMKDMKFNIDILWLDASKKVIKLQENVAPSTYPNSFCPDRDAQYVLEVNAGTAKAAGIGVGTHLDVR